MQEWITDVLGIQPDTQEKILFSIIALASLIFLRWVIEKTFFAKIENSKDRYYWTRSSQYVTGMISFLVIISIWVNEFRSIATVIGLLTAGLTIALKDPVVNVAGWIFLLIRRPFSIGDRIEIGNMKGDVIDIRMFQFTINEIGNWVDSDQSTGRIIHIPNGKIFTEAQMNYTQGFSHIWNEIGVLVTFESNWKKAKKILEEIVVKHSAHLTQAAEKTLRDASRKYLIMYTTLTPIVYTSVKDSGVMLTMRYLITPRRRRNSEEAIWEEVLNSFEECKDIDFAYPTQRIYYNLQEGKEGTTKKPNA